MQMTNFTSGHNYSGSESKLIVAEEFKFFETKTCEDLAIVLKYLYSVEIRFSLAGKTI